MKNYAMKYDEKIKWWMPNYAKKYYYVILI